MTNRPEGVNQHAPILYSTNEVAQHHQTGIDIAKDIANGNLVNLETISQDTDTADEALLTAHKLLQPNQYGGNAFPLVVKAQAEVDLARTRLHAISPTSRTYKVAALTIKSMSEAAMACQSNVLQRTGNTVRIGFLGGIAVGVSATRRFENYVPGLSKVRSGIISRQLGS